MARNTNHRSVIKLVQTYSKNALLLIVIDEVLKETKLKIDLTGDIRLLSRNHKQMQQTILTEKTNQSMKYIEMDKKKLRFQLGIMDFIFCKISIMSHFAKSRSEDLFYFRAALIVF